MPSVSTYIGYTNAVYIHLIHIIYIRNRGAVSSRSDKVPAHRRNELVVCYFSGFPKRYIHICTAAELALWMRCREWDDDDGVKELCIVDGEMRAASPRIVVDLWTRRRKCSSHDKRRISNWICRSARSLIIVALQTALKLKINCERGDPIIAGHCKVKYIVSETALYASQRSSIISGVPRVNSRGTRCGY